MQAPNTRKSVFTASCFQQWEDVPAFSFCAVFSSPHGLKCSLESTGSRPGGFGWKFSLNPFLPLSPLPSPLPCWEKKRVNRKPTFYVLCKIDIFNIVPVTMVTLCFLNWEKKKKKWSNSILRFSNLQWIPAKMSCHRNSSSFYFLNLKMMLVQSACVFVWVGVWYTCVHICIIYIDSIYYIYLYHISVKGCHGDQPQYICNSFHHPGLSCTCIHTRFSCKPSKLDL